MLAPLKVKEINLIDFDDKKLEKSNKIALNNNLDKINEEVIVIISKI